MTNRGECIWKSIGNLERIRMREIVGYIKPNPEEEKCESCDGSGTIRYTLTNVSEKCRDYLPYVPEEIRRLIR